MFSSKTISLFYASVVFFSAVSAAPVHQLETRAGKCADGGASPCICGGALGIRDPKVASKCPTATSFQFTNKASGTIGTVKSVAGNQGTLQCDHIVELQFIADQVATNPDICTHFQSAAGKADLTSFVATINAQPNLEFVEGVVNGAKGQLFSGNTLSATTQKAADGVQSYLGLLKGAKVNAAAKAVDDKMTAIMTTIGKTGFTGFAAAYNAKVNAVIASANTQKAKLPPAPAAGDPFVDETASTIAKCKREVTFWGSARDFVVRAVTGKKPAATAATGAACALPPPKTKATGAAATKATGATAATKAKPATAAATKGKTTTATKAKTVAAKKPATKATAAKTTVAKKPAVKKVAAKKPAVKKVAAKKPAVKKVAAKKPAVKKVAAKKPVKKVTAKKAKKL
jgi:histone H1/5